MPVTYTDPTAVTNVKLTDQPTYGHSVSGYGGKIPTTFMVKYKGRWRRVYVMCWSNQGTAYVVCEGTTQVLDVATEHRLREATA